MGRVARWRMGKGIYHVLNKGLNDSWILSREKDRNVFLNLLNKQKADFRLNIYHYAIMSNHFHLAIETMDMKELSAYIGSVCSLYSRYWHRQNGGGRGTIWQGRYKSIAVQKNNYMIRLGRYIERNPIAAKVNNITGADEYPWSSAAAYVKGKEDPLIVISHNPYWGKWGKDDASRQQKYAAYLNVCDEEDVKLFSNSGNIIGDDEFKASIRIKRGRPSIRKTGRPKKIDQKY
jgi:REP-associated tyrosine transposase